MRKCGSCLICDTKFNGSKREKNMFDRFRLKDVLAYYKRDFISMQWKNEKYKWEAVKWFQDNWDVNAPDFAEMLNRSLQKTFNLLASTNHFPKEMIVSFAKSAPEEVRSMFIALFDESKDIFERMDAFKLHSTILLEKYGNGAAQHYQYENAISTYLWLRYPDKYYIYKFSEVKAVAGELVSDYRFKKGAYADNIRSFLRLYDEINDALQEDSDLVNLFRSQLTESCYADPELRTLTIDVGFYISRYYSDRPSSVVEPEGNKAVDTSKFASQDGCIPKTEEYTSANDESTHYWLLSANPRIWSFSDIAVGEIQSFTLYNENGNKRRIFQNFLDAKAGDMIICYESNPVKQVVALGRISAEQDGEKLIFEKIEGLTSPIDYLTLKECPELAKMEYLQNPQGTLFKLTKGEYDFILDLIREQNPVTPESSIDAYSKNLSQNYF